MTLLAVAGFPESNKAIPTTFWDISHKLTRSPLRFFFPVPLLMHMAMKPPCTEIASCAGQNYLT